MPPLSLLQRLKERKLVQWALAYLAGAFVVFQGVEVMAEPWGISPTGWPRGRDARVGVGISGRSVLEPAGPQSPEPYLVLLVVAVEALV